MIANHQAAAGQETEFKTKVNGRPWTQPTFKYQAKCLQWLREGYNSLSNSERGAVNAALWGSGCEALLLKLKGMTYGAI